MWPAMSTTAPARQQPLALCGRRPRGTIAESPHDWRFESILWRPDHRPEIRIADAGRPGKPITIRPRHNAAARGQWRRRRALPRREMEMRMQRPITMLVADDSHVTVQLLTEAARLSKLPVRLSTTDNGRDCLPLLNGSNIDLAFIDVHMPELSGTEAFWSARKLGIKTFVTLMSSPPAAEAVDMAIKLRACEFLFKPFALDDAVAVITTYDRISSPTKALIVDDSSSVRHIVQKIVRGSVFNCEIAEAGDGETALMLARGTPFDVVFLDCNMPGMSGIATLKRLVLMQPSLKIVMISSERNATSEKEALAGGACAFLHKPFNSQDVDQVLHAAFGLR